MSPTLPLLLLLFLLVTHLPAVEAQLFDVYHVNRFHFGPTPINMNSGSAVGDMFFDLKMIFMIPFACTDPYFQKDCTMQEISGSHLVISKLQLNSVGSTGWGEYAFCNVGNENNTDCWGNACLNGTYCCFCGHPYSQQLKPCTAQIGRMSTYENFDNWPPDNFCNETSPEWHCWHVKIKEKLLTAPRSDPGWWYSTLDYGYCPWHEETPNCTWRVNRLEKVVNKSCHVNSFAGAIEAYNRSCFDSCGAVRNISSTCWAGCFYRTILGPDAGRVGGSVTGIPTAKLLTAWTAPFESDDPKRGGCPTLVHSDADLGLAKEFQGSETISV